MNDVLQRVAADGQKAVDTFLPSIKNPPQPPPRPPNPMAQQNAGQLGLKALLTYRKVRDMAHREVYGIPPDKPRTPEELFGNVLDVAHTRALSRAIANHPEEEQGRLIAEAHDSATRWIAANNGKVVVHGQVKTADSPKAAEALAAQIVNDTVTEHDERESGVDSKDGSGGGKDGDKPDEESHAPERPQPTPHDTPGERTPATRMPSAPSPTPQPAVSAQPSVPPSPGPDSGSVTGTGAVLDAPAVIDPPTGEIPPESTPQVGAEETPQEEAVAVDSGDALQGSEEINDTSPTVAHDITPEQVLHADERGSDSTDASRSNPGTGPGIAVSKVPSGSTGMAKGSTVTLRDGRTAAVQWHHPGAKLLRVKIAGSTKSTMINPDKDLA